MLAWVDAQRFQAGQVEFLGVAGIGLEDDLVLVMELHTVGVLTVATVVRTDARLDIPDAPGLRPQHR